MLWRSRRGDSIEFSYQESTKVPHCKSRGHRGVFMASATIDAPSMETMEDLVRGLGGVPLERILLKPAPGTATEKDLIAALQGPRKRICELVDGVLVEKPLGTLEAIL